MVAYCCARTRVSRSTQVSRRKKKKEKKKKKKKRKIITITGQALCAKPSPRKRQSHGSSNQNCENKTVKRPRPLHCGMTASKKLAKDEHASPPSSGVPPAPVAPDSVSPRTDEIQRRPPNFLASFTIAVIVSMATTLCPTNVPASCHGRFFGESSSGMGMGSENHSSWMPCNLRLRSPYFMSYSSVSPVANSCWRWTRRRLHLRGCHAHRRWKLRYTSSPLSSPIVRGDEPEALILDPFLH